MSNALICGGRSANCPASCSTFEIQLRLEARRILQKTASQLNLEVEPRNFFDLNGFSVRHALDYYDENIHSSCDRIYIGLAAVNSRSLDRLKLFESLLENSEPNIPSFEYSPRSHLLLWLSTSARNLDLLRTVLRNLPFIPQCCLSGLVRLCIERQYDTELALLISHGASATFGRYPANINDNPLICCARQFYRIFVHDFQTAEHWLEKTGRLVNICKLLLDRSDRTALLRNGCFNELIERCNILTLSGSGEVPRILLETPEIQDALQEIKGCSPLTIAFSHGTFDSYSLGLPFIARVIQHSILPLLRSGCRCYHLRGPSHSFENIIYHMQFLRLRPDDNYGCYRLWGRCDVITELLIEGQRKGSLNVRKLFLKATERYHERGGAFAQLILARYPRPLQNLARQAILRRLPLGLTRRETAIEQLDLPRCFHRYLKFEEFNLLPHVFDTSKMRTIRDDSIDMSSRFY